MDIMKLATGLMAQKLGGNNPAISGVLGKLIGSGDSADLGGLLSGLKENGLGAAAESWLGDGENQEVSAEELKGALGAEKITEAAAQLGTDEASLLDSLKEALPQMIDKSSAGGSLLDKVGGLGGLGNLAKKML